MVFQGLKKQARFFFYDTYQKKLVLVRTAGDLWLRVDSGRYFWLVGLCGSANNKTTQKNVPV